MEIVNIFAPYLFAFTFPGQSLDEYHLALYQWTDAEYLKQFYEENIGLIKGNSHFPVNGLEQFVEFISNNADDYDDILANAAQNDEIQNHFEILSKGKNIYELLPHRKSRFQVLRLYGIQLGDVIVIAGSAIKLTQEIDKHTDTARQLTKIASLQDFFRDNSIYDEDSFFAYLSEQD